MSLAEQVRDLPLNIYDEAIAELSQEERFALILDYHEYIKKTSISVPVDMSGTILLQIAEKMAKVTEYPSPGSMYYPLVNAAYKVAMIKSI